MHCQIFGDKDYAVTLSYWGGYLNINVWFMKNILFEQIKIKL